MPLCLFALTRTAAADGWGRFPLRKRNARLLEKDYRYGNERISGDILTPALGTLYIVPIGEEIRAYLV